MLDKISTDVLVENSYLQKLDFIGNKMNKLLTNDAKRFLRFLNIITIESKAMVNLKMKILYGWIMSLFKNHILLFLSYTHNYL